jgi:hypothetical protein
MATQAQILANQANAQLSTGPRTEDGRARSAANATKHGLSGAYTVLPHEDQDEFDELLENLRNEHRPTTHHQAYLIDQLAKTWWAVSRAQRLEARAFEHLAGVLEPSPGDPDSMIVAKMFKSNPNAINTLQRYITQNQNQYNKLWRELKAAKQIENEAIYANTLVRSLDGPAPGHPAATTDPVYSQYGYLPQDTESTSQLRAAARSGAAVPH